VRFILKTLFIFLLLLFSLPFILEINFSSFLKYSSYAECMKEEIKDNSGFHNSYIEDFCTNKFPKKFEYKADFDMGKDTRGGNFRYFWYSTFEECMIEEIKDNKNSYNLYIHEFCRIGFP
tara:strand:+ start:401 stop:760 length:360 start_codon:yes stop_codon:yes gene_type:complete